MRYYTLPCISNSETLHFQFLIYAHTSNTRCGGEISCEAYLPSRSSIASVAGPAYWSRGLDSHFRRPLRATVLVGPNMEKVVVVLGIKLCCRECATAMCSDCAALIVVVLRLAIGNIARLDTMAFNHAGTSGGEGAV